MIWLKKRLRSQKKYQSETSLEDAKYRRLTIMFGGGLFALVGIFVAFMPPKRDEQTLCTNEQIRKHVVILLDQTDLWTPQRGNRLKEEILKIRDGTRKDEKLSIYKFGVEDGAPELVFSLCNPGKRDEVNFVYRGGYIADAEYRKRFGQPLSELVDQLKIPTEAPYTFLVQAIRVVTDATDFGPSVSERELLVFSDMRQNEPAPGFSFLHSSPSPASFTNYVKSVVPSQQLKGLKIRVYVIPHGRSNPALDSNVRAAWQSLFKALDIQFTWSSI